MGEGLIKEEGDTLTKKKLKIIGKNVDESEIWINNLKDEKSIKILKDTLNDFVYLNDILYTGSVLKNGEVEISSSVDKDDIDSTR